MELADKNIIVTGAAGGFGQAIVTALVRAGARPALIDRDADRLADLATTVPNAVARACDLTDPEEVDAAVAALFEMLGRFDGLVNNAGVIHSAPLVDFARLGDAEARRQRAAEWRRVVEANLHTAYFTTLSVVERMVAKRTRGVVVNIGSIAARGNAGQSAYAAAKAGVTAMAATWARELTPFGIRAATIAPGFFDTPATRDALTPERIAAITGTVAVRRLGLPEELAAAVLFVLENDYFNGRVLDLDGGAVL